MSVTMVNGGGSNEAGPELYFQIVCDPGHERTARELSELPRESRERVWADMIGASTAPQNAPSSIASHRNQFEEPDDALVDQRLLEMESAVHQIPLSAALLAARDSAYAQNPEFRIGFLRAEGFDPKAAAARFARHFDHKLALFGESKLTQSIRLQDLSRDDIESLQSGGFQLLPATDRAGRLIMFSRYREHKYKHKDNLLRALWYIFMSILDNPLVGKAGMVIVGYEVGDYVPIDFELPRQLLHLGRTMPIRFAANHSCYDDTLTKKLADFVVHAVSNFVRLRLRIHCGSHQECRYRLLTMGIPVQYLPITSKGELLVENHYRWLQYRVAQEQAHGFDAPPNVVPPAPPIVEDDYDDDMEME